MEEAEQILTSVYHLRSMAYLITDSNGRAVVVEAEPGNRFAWAVGDPENAGATWAFDLTTEGAGTRVRQRVELGPGPSGLTRRIDEIPDREEEVIAARMNELRRNMTSTLAAMKSVAEQPA
mgnify:CR=1 FL=1